jgi:hypothetical protein
MTLIDRFTKGYVGTGSSHLQTEDAPKPDSSSSSSGIARTPDLFENPVSIKTALFSDPKPKTLISGNNQPPFPIPKFAGTAVPGLPYIEDMPAQPGITEEGENQFGTLVNSSDPSATTSKLIDYLVEPKPAESAGDKPKQVTSGNNQLPVSIPKSGPPIPAWLQSVMNLPAQPGITEEAENGFGSLVNSSDPEPTESKIIDYLAEPKSAESVGDQPRQVASGNNQLPVSIPKSGPLVPAWLQSFLDAPIQQELTQEDESSFSSVEEKKTISERSQLIDPEKH